MCGAFFTGIFADEAISFLDGATLAPGGWNGVGVQVGKQFAEITAISAYSFVVSCILLLALKYIPGMHLRVSEEAEMMGLDIDQFFDEQIGEADWEFFSQGHKLTHEVTHGIPKQSSHGPDAPVSSDVSVNREAVASEDKED
jgi:ammonium transporter, Amt family